MNDTPTPRTDRDTICDAIASKLNDAFNLYAWDDSKNHAKQIVMNGIHTTITKFETELTAAREELTAVTEQRDEARREAEKYRNLSCEDQDEADATKLPWENNQPTEP